MRCSLEHFAVERNSEIILESRGSIISNKIKKNQNHIQARGSQANSQKKLDDIQKNKFWTKNDENKG